MLKIKNSTPGQFRDYIQDKKVYIFGAGRALDSCVDIYFEDKDIAAIIDNNGNLWGQMVTHRGAQVPIISVDYFIKELSENGKENLVLFISSPFYAAEIVEQLDGICELDGLECFLQVVVRNTKEETPSFEFTKGNPRIPKTIHYIWVGENPLSDEYRRNINTWRKNNPDYDIIQWDESNYDFSTCDYIREAYEAKEWAFVSNYMRFDIIKEYGGIYLDTDVEVKKSLDCLLQDDAFFAMGAVDRINAGSGFGSIKDHPIVVDVLTRFQNRHFIKEDGKKDNTPLHAKIHPTIKNWGFIIENNYQCVNGVALYPKEVLSPLSIDGMPDFFSEKTLSVHREAGSWKIEREKGGVSKLTELIHDRGIV